MDQQGRLAGKKAFITGGGTGIGRGIALEFARQGADIAVHYSHSDKGARSAVEEAGRWEDAPRSSRQIL